MARRFAYTYIFPPGELFSEVRLSYERAAKRLGRITVVHGMYPHPKDDVWNNPEQAFIFWCQLPWNIPAKRSAKCILQFQESVGNPENLTVGQREMLEQFIVRAQVPDLIICGTPTVRDFWAPLAKRVGLSPIGYDAKVMGSPDWIRPKTCDVGFCGDLVGRREWILPALIRRMGSRFMHVKLFGRERNDFFNSFKAMLYVGHSDERAFADLRLWSAVSTSAALVTEARDAWPAIPGRHYLALPPARQECPDEFVDALEQVLKDPLIDIAARMHDDLSKYTAERCIEWFMIPTTESLP